MKKSINTSSSNGNVNSAVLATGSSPGSNSPAVAESYTSSNGAIFNIAHSSDYYGGDLSSTSATSLNTCAEICSKTAKCVAVSFVSPSSCYLKSSLNSVSSAGNVDAAVLQGVSPSAPNTCTEGITYTASKGGVFTMKCGIDYYGGDLSSASTASFKQCMDLCDANAKCIDVSYVSGACYLKSKIGALSKAGSVWNGLKVIS